MTTACSTFEVADLARSQMHGFEHRSHVLAWTKPFISFFAHRPVAFVGTLMARSVERSAKEFANDAVWFKGARDALLDRERSSALDPNFELVDRLMEMEQNLFRLRTSTLALTEKWAGDSARNRLRVYLALRKMAAASAELYEEVRHFRGAVMAYEADRGVAGPVTDPVSSVEAFDEAAKKLMRTA